MRRAYLVLSNALILATAALAQSGGGAAGDPVTGTWSGSVGPGSTPTAAQSSGEEATAVRAGFTELSDWIVKSAELIPADKYTYQPVKTVRTVGQQIAHIIDGQNYYCGRAAGQKVEWSDSTEKGATDRATLLPKLKQSMQTCAALYAGAFKAPLVANLGHGSLHYGNLVTYMRMLGLKPPSS